MIKKYILNKIRINILSQRKIYALLLLQLIFGVTIIVINLNVLLSYFEKGEEVAKVNSATTYDISTDTSFAQNNLGSACAITYEDYKWVAKEYSSVLNASYFLLRHFDVFPTQEKQEILPGNLVYVPDAFFKEHGYHHSVKDKVFVGKNVYGRMAEEFNIISYIGDIKFNGNESMDIGNKKELKTLQMDELKLKNKTIELGSKDIRSYNMDDCILVSCSLLEDYFTSDSVNLSFKINFFESSNAHEKITQILKQLEERHKSAFSYTASNIKANYDWINERIVYVIKMRVTYAIVVLMILLFGFTGILHIITYKRRKQIAISIMLGSNERTAIVELFVEIWAICITGALIGSMIGSLLTGWYHKKIVDGFASLFVATIHWESIVLVVFIASLMATLVTATTAKTIRRLQPIEILRSM